MKQIYWILLAIIGFCIALPCYSQTPDNTGESASGEPGQDIVLSDGTKFLADGTIVATDGTKLLPNGDLVLPDGTVIKPE